jgi:2-phosphosulfolactate phosphatase
MTRTLEVLFTPTEFEALERRDLSQTVCVVFDVLRATSTMVCALGNGAAAVVPVASIREALKLRAKQPEVLLAGERDGVRIEAHLTGSIDFDLGNSPREFTREKISGRTIVMTTTNGTRALRACAQAQAVLIGSFLNLSATAERINAESPSHLLLVCSGTHEEAAYEDVLGAGALCELLRPQYGAAEVADSTHMARRIFRVEQDDFPAAMVHSRNARRLLAQAELKADVPFCLQRDQFKLVAEMGRDGRVVISR